MKYIFTLGCLLLLISACNKKHNFSYEAHKQLYLDATACVLKKYPALFSPATEQEFVYLKAAELQSDCKGMIQLVNDEHVGQGASI